MAATRFGGYSSDINIDSRYVRALPAGWSMIEGAGYITQCLTAWYGLVELGRIARDDKREGPTVLIHSAAGGVGLFACEIVEMFGGKVIATIGSEKKIEFLMERSSLKREQIIVRTQGGRSFGRQLDTCLQHLKSDGIDVVFDSLGGDSLPIYIQFRLFC